MFSWNLIVTFFCLKFLFVTFATVKHLNAGKYYATFVAACCNSFKSNIVIRIINLSKLQSTIQHMLRGHRIIHDHNMFSVTCCYITSPPTPPCTPTCHRACRICGVSSMDILFREIDIVSYYVFSILEYCLKNYYRDNSISCTMTFTTICNIRGEE